jgi:hypothetical protein
MINSDYNWPKFFKVMDNTELLSIMDEFYLRITIGSFDECEVLLKTIQSWI